MDGNNFVYLKLERIVYFFIVGLVWEILMEQKAHHFVIQRSQITNTVAAKKNNNKKGDVES